MPSLQVLLKSAQRTRTFKLSIKTQHRSGWSWGLPINPTQTRVVLWVKACSYPNPQLSLGTGLSPVVGSTGEEESGIPHSVHGNCFLLVVCSTSLPWGAPAVHLPSHWGFHNWSNVGKILQAMSHTHVLTHSPAAQIRL